MQRVGFVCFLLGLFYSSTYISSDARGAIPGKYNSYTLVGLRHHVIARHALLSTEVEILHDLRLELN